MVNEIGPSPIETEVNITPHNDFEHSANQLLALAVNVAESQEPVYCAIVWDVERPSRIIDITPVTITATGAGRQLLWGQLHRMQLRIDGKGDAGAGEGPSFIWCSAAPRPAEVPAEIDEQALAQEHGYMRLDARNVVGALAERIVSIDDCIDLTKLIQRYQIDSTPELMAGLKRIFTGLIRTRQDVPIDLEKALQLAALYQYIGETSSLDVPGQVVSLLLRAIRSTPSWQYQEADESGAVAATTLAEALKSGVIPQVYRHVRKILIEPAAYAYPFAIDLLYSRLNESTNPRVYTLFGVNRLEFVHGYITAVAGAATSDDRIKQYLAAGMREDFSGSGSEESVRRLCGFVNGLSLWIDGSEASDRSLCASGLSEIPSVVEHILKTMQGGDTDDARDELIWKNIETVRMLLGPLLRNSIGRAVVEFGAEEQESTEM